LALIRSFLIDSDCSRASREAFCAKIFCAEIALHKFMNYAKVYVHRYKIFSDAAFAAGYRLYK